MNCLGGWSAQGQRGVRGETETAGGQGRKHQEKEFIFFNINHFEFEHLKFYFSGLFSSLRLQD